MTYDWPFFMKFYAVELEMVYKWSVHKFIYSFIIYLLSVILN
jgi:hypothetical protein